MRAKLSTLVLVAALAASACAGDSEDTSTGSSGCDGDFPLTVEIAGEEFTVDECPQRVVSLSPSATEDLYAVGAGEQVVAVDDQSDHPEGVPTTKLSGHEPNVEAVAGYEPDLVVASNDPGDLQEGLERLGITVIMAPAPETLEGAYEQIEQLAVATGHPDDGEELVETMKAEIEELAASVPEVDEPLTYFHELDDTLFTVTSKTFIGQVYSLAGFENIADPADEEGSGYPQLSAEFVVSANPDVIFLADAECCAQSVETVRKRPGWRQIGAVQENRVVELNEDIASRWGPRIVDFLQTIVDAAEQAASTRAGTS